MNHWTACDVKLYLQQTFISLYQINRPLILPSSLHLTVVISFVCNFLLFIHLPIT